MSMPRKICCTVESVIDHGDRVYTVDLVPATSVPLFRSGQFLHLTVDDYDPSGFWPESRVFSIASTPRTRDRVRVCYSVKGRYTARMEQTLAVGGTVWIKLPYGEFVIDDSRAVVLIAGGTGISAFTAFLEALAPETRRQVALVYGARAPSLFLFEEMIRRQGARVPALQHLFFAENVPPAGAGMPSDCFSGRIALDRIWSWLPQPASRVFYLSGPPPMLRALGAGLAVRGVPLESIRTDAWE